MTAPEIPPDAPIQTVFRILASDTGRNQRIAEDVLIAYREGRKILVLTERTDHLPQLREALGDEVENCFILHGRLSKKQRAVVFAELDALDGAAPRVLLATGRLIGEGFDHPHRSIRWRWPCRSPGKGRCSSTPGACIVSTLKSRMFVLKPITPHDFVPRVKRFLSA